MSRLIFRHHALMYHALMNNELKGIVVLSDYLKAIIGFKEIVNITPESLLRKCDRTNLEITFVNGSSLKFLSSDRPEKLRGYSLDFAYIDELVVGENKVRNKVGSLCQG